MLRYQKHLFSLVVIAGLVCTKQTTTIEDSESDQAALLRSYRTLGDALENRDLARLDSVVAHSFLDEGVDKAGMLAECDKYFNTYDSIGIDLHLTKAFFRIERNQALVSDSIRLAARHATLTDSLLIEWARGEGRWIREDEQWRLYGDQSTGPGAEAVEVVSPADETPLYRLAERVGAGLGILDMVISTVLYDTAGHDALTGSGWPEVTWRREFKTIGGAALPDSDSTGILPIDTVDTWQIDFTGYLPGQNDGIGKSGLIKASMKSFNPDSILLNLSISLENFQIDQEPVAGNGTITGWYRSPGDTLNVTLNLSVQNMPLAFQGYAIVDRKSATDRTDDDIRIISKLQVKSTCQVVTGTPYAFSVFGAKPSEPAYNLTLPALPGEYAFGYGRYDTYPSQGYLFADSLNGAWLGYLAYADEIKKLRAAWIDPVTQAVWPESVTVAYNDTSRHRVGAYGISGFLDDGQDILLKEPAAVTQESRNSHRFVAAVVFGYPAGTTDTLTVAIRLKDVNENNDTVVDTIKNLISFGANQL